MIVKPIKGYENEYAISSEGHVYKKETKTSIREFILSDGKISVYLRKKTVRAFLIENLMAENFFNDSKDRKIIHKDGDNTNNTLSNLFLSEKEIWKDVVGYEGRYQVSNVGNVRTMAQNGRKGIVRELKQREWPNGYKKVHLTDKQGRSKNCFVHRLVCMAFIGDCTDLEVNHKDGNPQNNRAENLEVCTRLQNIKHSWTCLGRSSWAKGIKGKYAPRSKPIIAKNGKGEIVAKAFSAIEMAKLFQIGLTSVLDTCCGKRKEVKKIGITFEFDGEREKYKKGISVS